MSEGWILTGNVFPKVPYTACTDFGIPVWCMVLISINGSLCTASVCDKYEVVFCQDDTSFLSVYVTFNCRCNLFVSFEFEYNICDFCIELEVHTGIFEVSLHRKNEGFILIIFGKFQCTEIRQSGNMVDKSLEI